MSPVIRKSLFGFVSVVALAAVTPALTNVSGSAMPVEQVNLVDEASVGAGGVAVVPVPPDIKLPPRLPNRIVLPPNRTLPNRTLPNRTLPNRVVPL